MDKILTKTGVLLFLLVISTLAIIYMNIIGVEVSDVFNTSYGALLGFFINDRLSDNEEKIDEQEILNEIGSESGIGVGMNR
jgi:glycopeptide antibiotics resistance protein